MDWPKWLAIGAALSLATWLLNVINEHGAQEAELAQYKAAYEALSSDAGQAIAQLEKQALSAKEASQTREAATVKRLTDAAATAAALQEELNEVRKQGDMASRCLDLPLPQPRAERVRELANRADKL